MNLLEKFNQKQTTKIDNSAKMVEFKVGDTVAVSCRIQEENTTRIQIFEGVVIAKSKQLDNFDASFTVRKISHGVGVERKFQFHSPLIEKIQVLHKGIVRRAKLYYLRDLNGKAARIKKQVFKKEETAQQAPEAKVEESSEK